MFRCNGWIRHQSLIWNVVNILWLWVETQKTQRKKKRLTFSYIYCCTYNFQIKSHKIQPHCKTFLFWRIKYRFFRLRVPCVCACMSVCVCVCEILWPEEVDVIAILATHALYWNGLLLLHSESFAVFSSIFSYMSYIDEFNFISISKYMQSFAVLQQWTDMETKNTMEKG